MTYVKHEDLDELYTQLDTIKRFIHDIIELMQLRNEKQWELEVLLDQRAYDLAVNTHTTSPRKQHKTSP